MRWSWLSTLCSGSLQYSSELIVMLEKAQILPDMTKTSRLGYDPGLTINSDSTSQNRPGTSLIDDTRTWITSQSIPWPTYLF